MAYGCMWEPPTRCPRRKRLFSPASREHRCHSGMRRRRRPGISRFRVRVFDAPRNDGAALGLNAAEPPSAVIGLPFDFRWLSAMPRNVAYRGKSGKHGLLRSISGFDPQATFWGAEQPAVILSRFKPAVAGMEP